MVKRYVYLLDEAMGMDRIRLISTNLAEKIAMAVNGVAHRVAGRRHTVPAGQEASAQAAHGI